MLKLADFFGLMIEEENSDIQPILEKLDVKTLIEIYNRMTATQQHSVKRNLLGF